VDRGLANFPFRRILGNSQRALGSGIMLLWWKGL
jgi:hypothetical protein